MKNIMDYFLANVNATPSKIAVICGEKRLTYKKLCSDVCTLSYHLNKIGVTKGAHIAIFLNNSIEFATVMFAAANLGAVIVPLPLTLKGKSQEKALKNSKCEFVIGWFSIVQMLVHNNVFSKDRAITVGNSTKECYFYDDFFKQQLDYKVNYDVTPAQDYILTMTSGSTGDPKPIVFTQDTKIKRSINGTKDIYHLNKNDTILVSTPMYHSLAQRSVLLPLLIGATAIILPKFSPKFWIDVVQREKVSFLFAVSNQLEILLNYLNEDNYDFSSLKTIVSSSALLKEDIKKQLIKKFDCNIDECYGTSEIGVATNISIKYQKDKIGSVGKPLPYVDIKICDENRNTLNSGKNGEIACKSLTHFSRYYGNDKATKNCLDENGYFYTGDLGYLDEDGYLYYLGRKKDIIITGGINVYPQDIEEILNSFDEVKESAVIGVGDSYFGEAIVAVLVKNDGFKIDLQKIRKACRENLTDYQQPIAYEIVGQLPKSALGKIMKQKLKTSFKGYNATKKLQAIFNRRK